MPLCISLVHSPHHAPGWSRCPQPAQPGDILCPAHRDALDGLAMGILETNLLSHAYQQRKASRQDGAFLAVQTPRIDLLTDEARIHPAKKPSRRRKRRRARFVRKRCVVRPGLETVSAQEAEAPIPSPLRN